MWVSKKKYELAQGHADELSAQAYSESFRADNLQRRLDSCATVIAQGDTRNAWLQSELDIARATTAQAQGRLAAIIAMETPSCANIGKRMAKFAREGEPRNSATGHPMSIHERFESECG